MSYVGVNVMNDDELLNLAFQYIINMANAKPYNIQAKAISNYFERGTNNLPEKDKYELEYDEFIKNYPINSAKDFIYKKDYYTTREMYLISPQHYLYYTYHTFKILHTIFHGVTAIDFSIYNFKVFYSGQISFKNTTNGVVKNNSNFNNSYNQFQEERNAFVGNKVLAIDIQDFFKSIHCDKLIKILKKMDTSKLCEKSINNLAEFYKKNDFISLPQLHYSIASSALSQLYLDNFTKKMSKILAKEQCIAVRFVDDIYIQLPKYKRQKAVNNMLNRLTFHLWKDGLNLNSAKTKVLNNKSYKKLVELVDEDYLISNRKSNYNTEKLISRKVDHLLNNNGHILLAFFKELKNIEHSNGIDLKMYNNLIDNFISIDGDHATKVINNLIYSEKWKFLDSDVLYSLLKDNSYVFFNPSQFMIFFMRVNHHLELIDKVKLSFIDNFVTNLKRNEEFTFRESIVTIQFFLQNKTIDPELVIKMKDVNHAYVNYIDTYINPPTP